MYFTVGLVGHFTSFCPGSSGAPTEWRHLIYSPSVPRTSITFFPTLVMMCIFTTTYSESVISTPMCESGEPTGPMLNGITYIVRPRMQPSNNLRRRGFISFGSTQLFVGPASSFHRLQI